MFFFSGEEKCSHFFFSPDRGYCRFRKWRKKNISLQKSVSIQSLGSSVRLSLKVREKWLQENVSCGLKLSQPAQVGLAAAQMYSTDAFTNGVAISISRRSVASLFDTFFDFIKGCVFATPDDVRFRV